VSRTWITKNDGSRDRRLNGWKLLAVKLMIKMLENNPPETIICGYPEKKYKLIGWETYQKHNHRTSKTANRNRRWAKAPIYKSGGGQTMMLMEYEIGIDGES